MYLLDTSVMFEILSATKTGAAALLEIGEESVAISSLTRYELLATRKGKRFEEMQRMLRSLPVIAYDTPCADVSADLKSRMSVKGKTISYHDTHIAGTCIYNNLILVTLDKHFANVPGLTVKKLEFES
ncbi:type II toxin-antitoxin system VapC family toxin [Candidatus Woesearchaeota archaeon]|nr:type II toxin-antitoxin system VapC family toxin [Candidatus Woesearchaeota archaeon]